MKLHWAVRVLIPIFCLASACTETAQTEDGGPRAPEVSQDASPSSDAGARQDAGVSPEDAGVPEDAGLSPEDAGVPEDVYEFVAFRSGSRLKANYLSGGGDAKLLVRWFDTTLDDYCRFAMDADFGFRCMPQAAASLSYSDDACTLPIFPAEEVNGRKYVQVSLAERCVGRNRVAAYQVLAATTELSGYYSLLDGECSYSSGGPSRVYRQAVAVDDREFVSARSNVVSAGSGLSVLVLETDDGAAESIEAEGTATGGRCFEVDLGDGTRCIPGDPVYDYGRFLAEDCTARVGYSIGAAQCPPPQHALQFERVDVMDCPRYQASLHSLGASRPAEDTYQLDVQNVCTGISSSRGHYWDIGEAQSFLGFPRLKYVALGNSGARLLHTATEADAPLTAGTQWQLADGQRCRLYEIDSTRSRCISGQTALPAPQETHWSDANCQSQRLLSTADVCSRTWTPAPHLIELAWADQTQSDTVVSAVFQAGAEYLGDVYGLSDGICGLLADARNRARFQVVGSEVALDTFPEVVNIQEPL